jgi:hypothetical protein
LAADPVVFKRFDSGTSLGTIGMIGASEDAPIDGPQAIYAADDGGVYLLDQLNGRVLRFDSKKSDAEVHSLTLPSDLRPTDLVVRKGSVYVWDGDVHALQAGGRPGQSVRGLSETRSADPTDDFTRTAFSQMGSQTLDPPVELLDDSTRGLPAQPRRTPTRQFVDSRGAGPVIADIAAGKDDSIAQIEVRKKGQLDLLAKLNVQVRDRLGAVEFLEVDANGRMFVLTENIPMTAAAAAAYVARFSPQGVLESIYDIPLSESVALSRRFVTVSPDGDVFFLRTRETGVDVLGVGARAVRKGGIIDDPSARRAPVARGKGKNAAIAAVRPLTRKRVIETALAFESSRWQLTKASYGEDPDLVCTGFQRVRRPGYLNGRQNQEVQGIPYCWGCMGSLPQIRASLSRGALAGNVCTRNAPRTDVVGVDCSAFVSATWGLATHFTTAAIPAIAAEVVNPWDMLPGDALNKAGTHVMLFLRFTPDRKVEVMESSTGACNGRVCRSIYPLSSLLARGYVPVRYRALAEDTAVAAAPANAAADPNSGKKEAAKGAPAQKRARQTSARPER